jgi:hypothetical protein
VSGGPVESKLGVKMVFLGTIPGSERKKEKKKKIKKM